MSHLPLQDYWARKMDLRHRAHALCPNLWQVHSRLVLLSIPVDADYNPSQHSSWAATWFSDDLKQSSSPGVYLGRGRARVLQRFQQYTWKTRLEDKVLQK